MISTGQGSQLMFQREIHAVILLHVLLTIEAEQPVVEYVIVEHLVGLLWGNAVALHDREDLRIQERLQ